MTTARGVLQKSLVIVTLVACSSWAISQEPGSQPKNADVTRSVRLSLIVTNRLQHAIDDLNRESIQILEGKTPQTVSQFAKDERPVDYGVVIDATGSFRKLLDPALAAARLVIDGNRDTDETFIERFISSNKIDTVQEFTPDKTELFKSLRQIYVEGGQSAVIDAVYLAVTHTADHGSSNERRRALVLFTDGEDRASYYSENQLFQLLRAKDVQIFVIGIVTALDNRAGLVRPAPRDKAEKLLKRLAQETGGRVFFPRNLDELREAAAEIAHCLHNQYVVGYESSAGPGKENFRAIEVKIVDAPGREKLSTITRPGYFVNPPDLPAKDKDKKKKSE